MSLWPFSPQRTATRSQAARAFDPLRSDIATITDESPRAAEQSAPVAVVILGMHRSGTSALTDAFSALGFALPSDGLGQPAEGAPQSPPALDRDSTGREAAGIVQLNNRILKDLGSNWDDPRLLTVRGQDFALGATSARLSLQDKYLAGAERALTVSFAGRRRIVVNDPRIGLFPELWDLALRRSGYSPRYVHIFRNPVEVAQSLRARNNIGAPKAHQLWMRYNLAILALDANGLLADVISYDDLMERQPELPHRLWHALRLGSEHVEQPEAAGFGDCVHPAQRHHMVAADAVRKSALVAPMTKSIFTLLENWALTPPSQRRAIIEQAARSFEEFSLLAGSFIALPPLPPPAARKLQQPISDVVPITRRIIIHYHLFKNAGTSVDAVLETSFASKWVSREFNSPLFDEQQRDLRDLISGNPEALAVSSHTLLLPTPQIDGLQVFPIIFVRHPIDRLKSAYDFEKNQGADTIGSRLARQTDFAGYVRSRLGSSTDRSCRNFQTHRLAMACPGSDQAEADRALAAVDVLPFVGLVEAFSDSMERLSQSLTPNFPDFRGFSVRKNASSAHRGLDERLDEIGKLLGPQLLADVIEANRADITLYDKVRALYLR